MTIATRLVDSLHGGTASGISVRLERKEYYGWVDVTSDDAGEPEGGLPDLAAGESALLGRGVYRLIFDLNAYFAGLGMASLCQEMAMTFVILNPDEHSELTLMVSPSGYVALWRRSIRK